MKDLIPMPQSVLEEVELDFYGFKKTVTVNTQTKELRILAEAVLCAQGETPVYWVFRRVVKGKYVFDHFMEQQKPETP
jgi:hypothetical protein